MDSESHTLLGAAFKDDLSVCVKVVDGKNKRGLFGGMAVITDYTVEAPYDDAMTYSISLEGQGELVDLIQEPEDPDTMPEGYDDEDDSTDVTETPAANTVG